MSETSNAATNLHCDKCGEGSFWSLPREGDPCPCGGKLVRTLSKLDTAATLKMKGSIRLSGGLHPDGVSSEAAGVAPNGRESVQGKDEEVIDFRHMMESNTPPPGIGASNSDWDLTSLLP